MAFICILSLANSLPLTGAALKTPDMYRRSFLKNTALASLALTAAPSQYAATAASGRHSTLTGSIEEASISELQKQLKSGQLSSAALTAAYMERIAALDKTGPKLNAIIELNPDAMEIAAKMDKERMEGKTRGPLHGIPFLVKDNMDTADKMMTTAGSLALMGNVASRDAHVVKLLRDAGVVLLGKSNLTEWSNFRSYRAVSGWSSRGGQTRNACVLDRNPSGSSAGSAVAVAASLCAVAVGTETNGSIISPASHNGIVGIKPTVGLVSRSGIIPISSSQDTAGPLARTVADAAIMLSVMAGEDKVDESTLKKNGKLRIDYTQYLDENGLKGRRIGVEKAFLKGHEGVVALYKNAIDVMKKSGATIVEVELEKPVSDLQYSQYTIFLYEFKAGINKYLAGANSKMNSLEDLIAFNKTNEATVMPYFKQEVFEEAQKKGSTDSTEYKAIINRRKEVCDMIDNILNKNNIECVCGVTAGLPGVIDIVNGDYDTGFYFGSPAAAAGFPHITVPMGKVQELPVGLSFVGSAYTESKLISLAFGYETASKKREAPRFLTTLIPS